MFDWFMEWVIGDYSDSSWLKIYSDILLKFAITSLILSYVGSICISFMEDDDRIDEEIVERVNKFMFYVFTMSFVMLLIPALGFICYWLWPSLRPLWPYVWTGLCWLFNPVTVLYFVLFAVTIAGTVFLSKVWRKLKNKTLQKDGLNQLVDPPSKPSDKFSHLFSRPSTVKSGCR